MNDNEISKKIEESLVEEYVKKSIDYLPNSLKFVLRPIIARNLRILSQKVRTPKIALYGRSGSGKSSLVNSILGTKVAPVPFLDLPIMLTVQFQMISLIAKIASDNQDKNRVVRKFINNVGGYTSKATFAAFIQQVGKLIPGAGIVLNITTAATIAALTVALGEAASKHFIEGVSIEDAKIIFESKNQIMKEKFITAFTRSEKDNNYEGIEEIVKEFY